MNPKFKKAGIVVACCVVVAAAGGAIKLSNIGEIAATVPPRCEGNGTCGMKFFKSLLEEQQQGEQEEQQEPWKQE
ncbi:MAG: hypothetical protein Q4C25_04895 [Bacillota bacterium]|nr:hypothetical protein [Bacillota bacterium]